MAIVISKPSSESYIKALCETADEIKLRAAEIIGDIDGQTSVSITINIQPHEIVTFDVSKTFIGGWKLNKKEESV